MIRILKKIIDLFLAEIDWLELLNGFLMILMGLVFTRHYGYRIEWLNFVNLCLWYLFLKSAIHCLDIILSGSIERNIRGNPSSNMNAVQFRTMVTMYFWVITITFMAVSFLPLYQIMDRGGLNRLSILIVSGVYLVELVFLLNYFNNLLSGLSEIGHAFTIAFLLPVLYFSLSRYYLKSSIILVTFPLFLQFTAWKIASNLDLGIRGKEIPTTSIIERIGVSDSLLTTAALTVLGCLTLFLDLELSRMLYKVIVLPFGLAAAWLVSKSIKTQKPYWEIAFFLISLLPFITSAVLIVSLWFN